MRPSSNRPRAQGAAAAGAAAAEPAATAPPPPAEEDLLADGPLIVPPQDKKSYRLFVLRNGMRVMVVHDPLVAAAEAAEAEAAAATAGGGGRKRRSPDDDQADDDDETSSGSYEEVSSGEAAAAAAAEEDEDESESESGSESESEEEDEDKAKKATGGGGDDEAPARKAACALAVGAGSFLDPPARQGLAHLLEHMLFMGSRRFPSENAYDDYLTRHGGSSNAYTELEYTNYHFEVQPCALKGALERLAAFCAEPLCLPGSLSREIKAVDSEFAAVQQTDHARLAQLAAHTARKGHPMRGFAWGNRASLWGGAFAAAGGGAGTEEEDDDEEMSGSEQEEEEDEAAAEGDDGEDAPMADAEEEAKTAAAPQAKKSQPPKKKTRARSASGGGGNANAATTTPSSSGAAAAPLKKRASSSSAFKLGRTASENGTGRGGNNNNNNTSLETAAAAAVAASAPKGAAGRRAAALRADLLDFHSRYYGAERMALVIVGGRPLDELQRWAEELFGAVPRRAPEDAPRPAPAISFASAGAPFSGRRLFVAPAVKQHHEVTVTFQLPAELRTLYGRKAEHYISHLVGHEGPGSLLSALKARGWATGLCAGVEEDGYASNSAAVLFSVTVTLTEAGLAAAPGLGLAPVALLFAYLRLLREGGGASGNGAGAGAGAAAAAAKSNGDGSGNGQPAATTTTTSSGPPEWVWRELAAVAATRFRFQEDDEDPCDAAARLAPLLLQGSGVKPRHALCFELLHEEWDAKLVERLLRERMDAAKSEYRVDVMTSAFPAVRAEVRRQREAAGGAVVAAAAAPARAEEQQQGERPASPEHCHYHHHKHKHPHPHHHHDAPASTQTKEERPPEVEEADDGGGASPSAAAAAAAAAAAQTAALLPARVAAAVSRAAAEAEEIREPWFGLDAISAPLPKELTDWWAGLGAGGGEKRGKGDDGSGNGSGGLATPAELALPPPNPFVPTDFTLVAKEGAAADAAAAMDVEGGPQQQQQPPAEGATTTPATTSSSTPPALPPPDLLEDAPGLRLWHVLDRAFKVPRAHAFFRISSPAASASPRAAALTHLWLRLAADALTEDAYLADVAGLTYGLSPEGAAGVEVRLDGFSHRMPELARRVFAAVAGVEVRRGDGKKKGDDAADEKEEQEAFAAVKESLVRKYRNMNVDVGRAGTYARLHALSAGGRAWHCDAVLAELEKIGSAQEVRCFVQGEFLARCHVEALVAGNASASWARGLVGEALAAIERGGGGGGGGSDAGGGQRQRAVLPAAERPADRCVVLPLADSASTSEAVVVTRLVQPAKNRAERNCCVEAYFQFGPAAEPPPALVAAATAPAAPPSPADPSPLPWRGLKLRALADLADQVLSEPLYDSLRTKQQLGYGVSSGARLTHGAVGFCACVVSAAFSAAQVSSRIDTFLSEFGKTTLARMTPREFAQHRDVVARHKLLADTCLLHAAEAQWQEVASGRYEFAARRLEAEAVRSVTLEELRDFYALALDPASRGRRALVVRVEPLAGGAGGEGDNKAASGGGGKGRGAKGKAATKKQLQLQQQVSQQQQPAPEPPGGLRFVDIGEDGGEEWKKAQALHSAPGGVATVPAVVAGAEE